MEPLYPLPVSDNCFDSINMDFIGLLPKDEEYNMLMTVIDWLGSTDIYLISCYTTNTTPEIVYLFFDNWYCKNELSLEIISNWDKLFISQFWKELYKQTGVKLKMSSAYYLETNRAAECTNKIVNQILCFYID